jgi:hypothetical protein
LIRVRFVKVRPDKVDELREWFGELGRRKPEVLATFEQESTRAERVHLLSTATGPVLVYVMDVADPEKAAEAFRSSTLPIDVEHKAVMRACCADPVDAELLFECSIT